MLSLLAPQCDLNRPTDKRGTCLLPVGLAKQNTQRLPALQTPYKPSSRKSNSMRTAVGAFQTCRFRGFTGRCATCQHVLLALMAYPSLYSRSVLLKTCSSKDLTWHNLASCVRLRLPGCATREPTLATATSATPISTGKSQDHNKHNHSNRYVHLCCRRRVAILRALPDGACLSSPNYPDAYGTGDLLCDPAGLPSSTDLQPAPMGILSQ